MTKPLRPPGLATFVLCGVLGSVPLTAAAQVYKCPQANGTVSFQATPCPGSLKAPPVIAAPPRPAASKPYDDPYAQAPNGGQRGTLGLPAGRDVPTAASGDNLTPRERWLAQKKIDDEARAKADAAAQKDSREKELQRMRDENQAGRCAMARGNLNILSEQHPVFRVNAKGERVFVSDENRQAEVANAQQQVAQYCR